MFDRLTAEARRPHWYLAGAVPDTLDGRFAVLSTLTAIALIRLERGGLDANGASVALTERFIEVMESEHRELGLGDPTLGKTVRKLVGMLARRTEMWRAALANERPWDETVRESFYKDEPDVEALSASAAALRDFWARLKEMPVGVLMQGQLP